MKAMILSNSSQYIRSNFLSSNAKFFKKHSKENEKKTVTDNYTEKKKQLKKYNFHAK